jgi:hypothetical protein
VHVSVRLATCRYPPYPPYKREVTGSNPVAPTSSSTFRGPSGKASGIGSAGATDCRLLPAVFTASPRGSRAPTGTPQAIGKVAMTSTSESGLVTGTDSRKGAKLGKDLLRSRLAS